MAPLTHLLVCGDVRVLREADAGMRDQDTHPHRPAGRHLSRLVDLVVLGSRYDAFQVTGREAAIGGRTGDEFGSRARCTVRSLGSLMLRLAEFDEVAIRVTKEAAMSHSYSTGGVRNSPPRSSQLRVGRPAVRHGDIIS